jgi:hypothetical protein
MDEESILKRIGDLVDEEHGLRSAVQSGALPSEQEQARLRYLEESLDQCWDLLRRRRAARSTGQDPDQVGPRSVGEVEGYLQ